MTEVPERLEVRIRKPNRKSCQLSAESHPPVII
jgi:hypothetical protein